MKYAGFWIVLLLLLTDLNQSFAQGDLMIYPRRLVFGSSQRSMDVTLANSGTDSSTYALSWKNYRMTSSGQFTEITEPDSGQYLADEILRFFSQGKSRWHPENPRKSKYNASATDSCRKENTEATWNSGQQSQWMLPHHLHQRNRIKSKLNSICTWRSPSP